MKFYRKFRLWKTTASSGYNMIGIMVLAYCQLYFWSSIFSKVKSEFTRSSCINCKVYHQSVFCTLGKDKWISKKKVKINKDENLYAENETIKGAFCIKSGQVAILKSDCFQKNNTVIIDIIRPGEIPGASSLLHPDMKYTATARAIQEVEACFISTSEIMDIIKDHPKIAMNFLRMLAQKLADQEPCLRQSIFSV